MTPAARLQAAIELLDDIIAAARGNGAAADTLIKRYFRDRRYAGSKDRRAVRDLVYRAIRRYGEAPVNGRAAMVGLAQDEPALRDLFDGSVYGPAPLGENEVGALPTDMPQWLLASFADTLDETDIDSLTGRAPLDIRVNLGRTSREAVLDQLDGAEAGKLSPSAVRLPQGFPIEQHALWREGLAEIQDEGSQYIVDRCAAEPGMTVVDLCAGAGGKTLALHDRMGGEGRLIACDVDRKRLSRLAPRAARAGMTGIETRLLDPGKENAALADITDAADIVLVDAPCSGTGTWRRNPEARWRLDAQAIARYAALQAQLLETAAPLVKPGGFLVYIVCSLLAREGEGQIAHFLQSRSDFSKVDPANDQAVASGDGFVLTPARLGTDGFFFARLQRSC
ncbi:RsmB/NOP family class I SAM-dependent RNA methyltransferase [Parasphingopyxis algicola]|uniref:RsmB/NOP family class I SAM-dependent RNA methyltransferase n=1 Tax=Parasphingopyxis algicola TaxID=2026624 RepID=UPI0015A3ECFD|nr:RsmB/NOP family class I SAM-dependent RNA methyltransferase [Parasphingopyxis algicola]QLC24117.1 RsmB/NOP family class I SAM-dependent RNA methyltransferase [Parasphingopyxis algicola]